LTISKGNNMSHIKLATIVFSFLFVTATAWASEADELREKAEAIQREAAALAEHGHKELATNLKRKAMAMLEEAERHGRLDQRHTEIVRTKRLLEKLRQEEKKLEEEAGPDDALALVRREAEKMEDKLRHLVRESHDAREAAPKDEIARRLEHMRIAVDHLHEAGLHDIAEHVAERAEATERELHKHHGGDVMHEIMKQLDALRHEVGRLRDEVNELRKKR
jgi:hypothetical protein